MPYRSVIPKPAAENLRICEGKWKPVYKGFSGSHAFPHAVRTARALYHYDVMAECDSDLSNSLNHIALSHIFKRGAHTAHFPREYQDSILVQRAFITFNLLRDNDLGDASRERYATILETPCLGLVARMVDLTQYGKDGRISEAELSPLDPNVFYVFKEGRGKTEYELIGHAAKNIYSPLADLFGYRYLAGELYSLYYYHIDRATHNRVETALAGLQEKIAGTTELARRAVMHIAMALADEEYESDITVRAAKHQGKVMEKAERYSHKTGRKLEEEVKALHDHVAFKVVLMNKSDKPIRHEDYERVAGIIARTMHGMQPLRGGIKKGAVGTDMVKMRKPNGYQSYHVDMVFESDDFVGIEAIIRDVGMEAYAEHGGAAHYLYKGGGELAGSISRLYRNIVQAIKVDPTMLGSGETAVQKRIDIYSEGNPVPENVIVDINCTVAEAMICAGIDLLNGPSPIHSYAAPVREMGQIYLINHEKARMLSTEIINVLIQKAVYLDTRKTLEGYQQQLSQD